MSAELERIAAIIAAPDDLTDGECLELVWAYLVGLGIDPDEHRGKYIGATPCTCDKAGES